MIGQTQPVPATPEAVLAAVAREYETSEQRLTHPGRRPWDVEARAVASVMLSTRGVKMAEIGVLLQRDRTDDELAMIEQCEEALSRQQQRKGVA
jgi:hypothetical protein